jgi:uncharacterized protein YqeY
MEHKSIIGRLSDDLKAAMKARDADRMATLRMAISAMNYRRIERNVALSTEEEEDVLRKQVKQRDESIAEFTKGARADLADKERREREILKEYLPPEMSEQQLQVEVRGILAGLGPDAKFSDAMKAVMPVLQRRANGKAIQEAVKAAMATKS